MSELVAGSLSFARWAVRLKTDPIRARWAGIDVDRNGRAITWCFKDHFESRVDYVDVVRNTCAGAATIGVGKGLACTATGEPGASE